MIHTAQGPFQPVLRSQAEVRIAMTQKEIAYLQICLALVFAGAILVSSWLLGDSGQRNTVVFLLIAAWWVPFSALLSAGGHSIRGELTCFKRRIGGLFARGK